MTHPAFPQDKKTVSRLLKHWDALLNFEESKACKLVAIDENMAALEGRNYLKLNLENPGTIAFFSGESPDVIHDIGRDAARFLLRLKLIERRDKNRRSLIQTEFFGGYPVAEVTLKGQRPYLTSLIKSTLNAVQLRDAQSETLPDNVSADGIEQAGGQLVITKPAADSEEDDEELYFTDSHLLEEVIGVDPEKVRRFANSLHKGNSRLTTAMLHDLFDAFPDQSETTDVRSLCYSLNALFGDNPNVRLRFYPYGMIWFSDNGQPTLTLRRDMQRIMRDELVDGLPSQHPFMAFFTGTAQTLHTAPTPVVVADSNAPTPCQKKVLENYGASSVYAVVGPPGTGKTKVIRDLITSRLYMLCRLITNVDIPENVSHVSTLVTGTNNASVDNSLQFFDFSATPDVLPCFIRIGNRKVLRTETLPFLLDYARRLSALKMGDSEDEFTDLCADFQKKTPTDETQSLHRVLRLHTLWVIQNQPRVLKLLDRLCHELDETGGIRTLFNRNNMDLFSMVFPVIGTTLLSVSTVFPLKTGLWGLTVVDEAGQCPPPYVTSVLYRTRRLIVFGDKHQLEPIYGVTSEEYSRLKALRSVDVDPETASRFMPLENSGISLQSLIELGDHPKTLLHEHFRCRAEIIGFCAELCGYDLRVVTPKKPSVFRQDVAAPGLFDSASNPAPTQTVLSVDSPFGMYQVNGFETTYSGSWVNADEAEAVARVYIELIRQGMSPNELAVLTPFRGQMNFIYHRLARLFSQARGRLPSVKAHQILVATAHRFQGRERDAVIFSPVTVTRDPLFLNSRINILNVAVSRAKSHFILVGSTDNMQRGTYTARLLDTIERHGKAFELPPVVF